MGQKFPGINNQGQDTNAHTILTFDTKNNEFLMQAG